ncbi:DUF2927 domain-containing protein [Paracoccaceae bacterium]|nr:DUF2927 domain-containing protein [Paracoccaceae bacterium]MDC0582702.1 DUF2927 domain-containing protein [Paracoccaceae bacterium]
MPALEKLDVSDVTSLTIYIAMKHRWKRSLKGAGAALILSLSGCAELANIKRGAEDANKPAFAAETSRQLRQRYDHLATGLIAQGLLRTDAGSKSPRATPEALTELFNSLAFYDEYEPSSGFQPAQSAPTALSKWQRPVNINLHFGPSLSPETRVKDTQFLSDYAAQLSDITRHPIELTTELGNFHVVVVDEVHRMNMVQNLRKKDVLVPPNIQQVIQRMPADIHCMVLTFSARHSPHIHEQALAVIRAEHPPVLKKACFHEEIAQGLGLHNDNPAAHPSIFNDDDEFAFLTNQDALLLRVLYDPRLPAGIKLQEAQPLLKQLIIEHNTPSR